MYDFRKPKKPGIPIKSKAGYSQFNIEYPSGKKERAFGVVWKINGKYFFDKIPDNGKRIDWVERWNNWEYAPRKVSSKEEIMEIAQNSKDNFREFQHYWVLRNCPEITKNYHQCWDTSKVKKEEIEQYEKELYRYEHKTEIQREIRIKNRERMEKKRFERENKYPKS